MNKLTNKEISRVFEMYSECEVLNDTRGEYTYCGTTHDRKNAVVYDNRTKINLWCEWKEIRFEALPIQKISDEDAIEVYKLSGDTDFHERTKIEDGRRMVSELTDKNPFFYACYPFIYQYLISKGYAVPIYFSPNHWANGKDAITLGIAIEKPL